MKGPQASALADILVTASDGGAVRLGDLWSNRPVVLALLRHFG